MKDVFMTNVLELIHKMGDFPASYVRKKGSPEIDLVIYTGGEIWGQVDFSSTENAFVVTSRKRDSEDSKSYEFKMKQLCLKLDEKYAKKSFGKSKKHNETVFHH